MSIINQVLLDLDKRRASGADRNALPDHVRALPEARENGRKWLIAVLSGMAVAAVVAWVMMSGFASRPGKNPSTAITEAQPAAGNRSLVETAAKSEAIPDLRPRDQNTVPPETMLFGRLSLDLSNPPVAVPEDIRERSETPEANAPIATSQVVGKSRPVLNPQETAAAVPSSIVAPSSVKSRVTVATHRAPATAAPPARIAQATPLEIQKKVIKPTPQQLAEQEYGKASTLLHQGKRDEARDALVAALQHYPGHMGARQGLFGMMIDDKKFAEAERIMQEGLQLNPAQIGFAMALARLQLDQGNTQSAIDTLNKSLAYAQNTPDYLAFLAALLQREKRHAEAVEQYAAALKLQPQSGVWMMGLGISLQALNRKAEAQEAFRRARASGNLTPELRAYVDQRLLQLQ